MNSHSHEPYGYVCPFCLVVQGIEDEENKLVQTKQRDIVYQDDDVTALIASLWWPNNKGHVIIIPNHHYENIFDLPNEVATKIHATARRIAFALKDCYKCDGVSTRQHNEPGGNQDVWHYHLHVYPRFKKDNLYKMDGYLSSPKDRIIYADLLKDCFKLRELG